MVTGGYANENTSKIGLMHDAETSREIKKSNGTLKTTKIKNSAAPVDREDLHNLVLLDFLIYLNCESH